MKKTTSFQELLKVMKILRGPKGCPWDKEQDHASLKQYLIEETYEVIDTIDDNDMSKLKEELGDLLLQVVFHAQIAEDQNEFTIDDIIQTLIEKLTRRHPHVFGDKNLSSAEQVLKQWHKIKKAEHGTKRPSVIDGVPRKLPALQKAHKLQKKASRVGFDWDHIDKVLAKVDEELQEVKEAIKTNDKKHIYDELGDLLFSTANLSRFLGLDPEGALRGTIRKFTSRFQTIEKELSRKGKKLEDASLAEMDAIWNKAKKIKSKNEKGKR
ncbi:MAG: nucleoside triphosphate pyrophosphohydrolase [Candidatus Ancaeobacter aquaticus]|nr:nucleoside triphosphate pyrophosphohydrolase [Candidatus Ancaeobacter aquaticus]